MLQRPDTDKELNSWVKEMQKRTKEFSEQGYGYTRKKRDRVANIEPWPRMKLHPKKRQGGGPGGVW